MSTGQQPAWQDALDGALRTAASPVPATALLAGYTGAPEDAGALRSLLDWFAAHAQSPVLDATGDDGAVASALARRGFGVVALRRGRPAQAVRATLAEQTAEVRNRIDVTSDVPGEVGCALLAGSLRAEWAQAAVGALAPRNTPVCAAVDAEGLEMLAARCEIDDAALVDGLARVQGRLTTSPQAPPLAPVAAAALAAGRRARAGHDQAAADDDDARWRQTSAELRAEEAEHRAREAEKAARRAERELQRAERQLREATAERDAARADADAEQARVQGLATALEREQLQRAAMRQRRWWRLGEVLAAARRSPRALLRVPADVVRVLRGR